MTTGVMLAGGAPTRPVRSRNAGQIHSEPPQTTPFRHRILSGRPYAATYTSEPKVRQNQGRAVPSAPRLPRHRALVVEEASGGTGVGEGSEFDNDLRALINCARAAIIVHIGRGGAGGGGI